eukprot:g825.t1
MTGFRALNGVGLGIVQPLLFSLVADKSSVYGRGKAFGFLLSTGSLGQTAFTAFATSIAPLQIGAIAGWQFALTIIASLSVLVGLLVWCLVTDVPRAEQRSMLQIVKEETPRLGSILCLPTFLVIIGQGIFGTAPWFAFSYLTMWLELNCFANTEAATILAFFNVGTALSSMLGGILLDFIFRRFPDHGPPGISQVSVFLSIPLFALILFGLGHGDSDAGTIALYCSVFMVTGMLIAWNMVMNNKMFSDVVPRERYTYIYALDRCIEGTFGAFGQPAVGWLTDRIFHFDAEMANSKHCSPSDALSLGKGVFSVAAVGFGICFLCLLPRISAENLLQLDSFKPHQELQAAGLLELHDPEHRDARVTFVSHEWSSFDHPDPQNAQLHSLQQMILGIRDGSIQLRHDMNSYFRPAMTRPVSLQEPLAASGSRVQEDMRAAVMSLHTYVAHCSFFVVLAPIQYHTSGRLMSYSSWKSRGWCQFELAVNGLLGSGTKPVLNVDTKTVWHVHYLSFWQLSPCCGDFTKDEDRYFIADALQQVMEHMEDSLRAFGMAWMRKRGIDASRVWSPCIPLQDRSSSSGLWPGLHYAAALDDVELVRTLLKADADVNACTQCKDLDFQLQCGQTPLHVWAAFSRDPAVAEALLQRKAEVDALDDDRITPLMIACQMGNEASCRTQVLPPSLRRMFGVQEHRRSELVGSMVQILSINLLA